jgi:aryl-alcohol dehydrogenase-like predicted oxidoreductase
MHYAQVLGRRISRLMLGTVQLGLDYGVANRTGRPPRAEARAILKTAFRAGVNAIDTARSYGDSELLLGELLAELDAPADLLIETKTAAQEVAQDEAADVVSGLTDGWLVDSLRRLRRPSVEAYLLHRFGQLDAGGGTLMDLLRRRRAEGRIAHLGVSLYSPEEAERALVVPDIEVVQAPFSVFDQRLRRSGFLPRAQQRGLAVFTRSAFLQGLVLMPREEVPAGLSDILPLRDEFERICRRAERPEKEVALRFPLTQPGITSVLVGVETAAQLRELLDLLARPALAAGTVRALEDCFADVPEDLINPATWPARAA